MKKPRPISEFAKGHDMDLRVDNLKWWYTGRGPRRIVKDSNRLPEWKCAVAINLLMDATPLNTIKEFYDTIGISEDYHDELASGNIIWKDSVVARHLILHWNVNALYIYGNSAEVWCGSSPKQVIAESDDQ